MFCIVLISTVQLTVVQRSSKSKIIVSIGDALYIKKAKQIQTNKLSKFSSKRRKACVLQSTVHPTANHQIDMEIISKVAALPDCWLLD